MGGDHAPARIVDGALAAARHLGIGVDLVGRPDAIRAELARHDDAATLDVRSDRRARRRRDGRIAGPGAAAQAAGVDSRGGRAGGAGAMRRRSSAPGIPAPPSWPRTRAFGMLPGVDRPALAPSVPTRDGSAVLIDAGATVECKPAYLLQFGVMGVGLRAHVAGHRAAARRPAVDRRGRNQGQRADARSASAAERPRRCTSSATSRRATSSPGQADVIVCDGFTGNVALKLSEGLVEMVEDLLGEELQSTFSSQVGYLLSRRAFRRFRRRVDYSEYGGAPLMGVAGLCIVGHGRSSAKAVRNAVAMASRFVSSNVLRRVEQEIAAAVGRLSGRTRVER